MLGTPPMTVFIQPVVSHQIGRHEFGGNRPHHMGDDFVTGDWLVYRNGVVSSQLRSKVVATVSKLGGHWVIFRNRDVPRTGLGDQPGSSDETAADMGREFWTGNGWAGQYGLAMHFATSQEAEDYRITYLYRSCY